MFQEHHCNGPVYSETAMLGQTFNIFQEHHCNGPVYSETAMLGQTFNIFQQHHCNGMVYSETAMLGQTFNIFQQHHCNGTVYSEITKSVVELLQCRQLKDSLWTMRSYHHQLALGQNPNSFILNTQCMVKSCVCYKKHSFGS